MKVGKMQPLEIIRKQKTSTKLRKKRKMKTPEENIFEKCQ